MNPGVAPLDPTTPVGQLRALVGDTEYRDLTPPVAGQGDYSVWSDVALEAALALTPSPLRAAGFLYLQLAAEYAQTGRSITTDDLRIDSRGRGADLHAIAKSFLAEATESEAAESNDFFQIVPFAGRAGRSRCVRPEATPNPLACCGGCS